MEHYPVDFAQLPEQFDAWIHIDNIAERKGLLLRRSLRSAERFSDSMLTQRRR